MKFFIKQTGKEKKIQPFVYSWSYLFLIFLLFLSSIYEITVNGNVFSPSAIILWSGVIFFFSIEFITVRLKKA